MDREIYLDNNATTRPLPEVRNAVLRVLDEGFGNASSVHSAGDRAREAISAARASVAALVGAEPQSIVFTSGATEANNMVITSAARRRAISGTPRIVTCSVEHSSILNVVEYVRTLGVEVVTVPVDSNGRIDLPALQHALTPGTALVSIQWANNETGVLQPIEEIGRLCRIRGVPFHTDAAQAVGKISINVAAIPVDFLSATAHKFHGVVGTGALYVRDAGDFAPLLHGGPQEAEMRPGTENLIGIVGLGTAADLRQSRLLQVQQRLQSLRDFFESCVLQLVPNVEINGDRNQRLCNTSNLRFAGVDGQALVARLDQRGIRCSQSSACTNRRPEPSYVLRAMGLSEQDAYASVRFSVGEWNTEDDIDQTVHILADLCHQLRVFHARYRNPYRRPAEVF